MLTEMLQGAAKRIPNFQVLPVPKGFVQNPTLFSSRQQDLMYICSTNIRTGASFRHRRLTDSVLRRPLGSQAMGSLSSTVTLTYLESATANIFCRTYPGYVSRAICRNRSLSQTPYD